MGEARANFFALFWCAKFSDLGRLFSLMSFRVGTGLNEVLMKKGVTRAPRPGRVRAPEAEATDGAMRRMPVTPVSQ